MSEPSPPERDPPEPATLSDHLMEYLREPMLWPVLIVAAAILLTLGIALLLAAVVQRNLAAMAALALLAGLSGDLVMRELRARGAGWVTGLVLAFWMLSGAGAFAVVAAGLF